MADARPGGGSVYEGVKRALDVALAGGVLLAALPLLAAAAALIRMEDRGPVFYRQVRVGRDGRTFQLLKLRSMRVNQLSVGAVGQVGGDHHLVTRVGRWVRRFKVDELPQLLNVLRGDMSTVGPRPTVPEQVEQYDDFQRARLRVRPGMTGWAQVNGNVELSWDDRIRLDVWYVDHRSLPLDLRILLRTLGVVLFGERPNHRALALANVHADSSGRRGR